ncbi:MAG TPA: pyruvate carboxylase [Gemmataceae bacterium]|nr:pyruvate carboxylase [Gemmataceae bacterium]
MPEEAQTTLRPIRKLLVANRSEIAIRVFRTATELGIRTVAIYSHEDRFALHRFKADEAYHVGKPGEPIRAYLDIAGIIAVARQHEVDAIHPGYGFLSENPNLARACEEAGLIFIGPRVEILEQLGDKVVARDIAQRASVPVLPGSTAVQTNEEAHRVAEKLGFPVMVKAAMGGGGRGMRVAVSAEKLDDALDQARREAGSAFGIPDVFLEKYIARARHIEVQLIGDHHGNLVHLFERDCSLQRRHQKMVEIAPAVNLDPTLRQRILDSALAVGRAVRLDNAGTIEFLVDVDSGNFYFIEVNPRIQVEHTVTEEVTGYDVVKSQILIAQGHALGDREIGLGDQGRVITHGYALQCRVTTEDPANNFLPDYGKLSNYRSASGMGIRLDAGSAFTGAVITPFYDSMLVKVTAHGLRFEDAARRMVRSLQEFRVRGIKTNIPFLVNLVSNPAFLAGGCTTRFIDETPALFKFPRRQDRATRLLRYIADVIVNGHPDVRDKVTKWQGDKVKSVEPPPVALSPGHLVTSSQTPPGTRDKFRELGPDHFARWVREQQRLLITDTTFRDAHQSLLATRMRSYDMLRIAPYYAARLAGLFSLEMWGGATFDTAMRFLKESPWQRLADLRSRVPNILFQMLLRSASAVGYTNYPDNVVQAFVKESAQAGIDLFRIFDALNGLPNLQLAIEAVRDTGMLCEAAICYTGDILDPSREKYSLSYFVNLAKELEKRGANLLAIKDMAGLCKPYAAQVLVRALRQEVGIPIHFHTHDCAGGQIASYLLAAEEGVSIVDCAMAPFSSMTSQPSLHALVEALRLRPRSPNLDDDALQEVADYWSGVRRLYAAFETGQLAPTADVYLNEMPGGQYTNLYHQAQALGLESRWREVCRMYAEVNRMFGDIIKVTPTSKVVGDMALFMVGNNLTPDDVLHGRRDLSFPESVVEFFEGRLGEPPGGFPEQLQKRVLRGRQPLRGRPGASLPPIDFAATRATLEQQVGRTVTERELLSYLLYPRVFPDLAAHQAKYSDTSVLPTPVFFYGMEPGEETSIDIERGKTLILKFLAVGEAHADGSRTVFFELNGQPREVVVIDRSLGGKVAAHPKAEPGNPKHVGAPMPGLVVRVMVEADEQVVAGQKLFTLEAMKMETTIYAERPGAVAEILVQAGTQVDAGDLLLRYEE